MNEWLSACASLGLPLNIAVLSGIGFLWLKVNELCKLVFILESRFYEHLRNHTTPKRKE